MNKAENTATAAEELREILDAARSLRGELGAARRYYSGEENADALYNAFDFASAQTEEVLFHLELTCRNVPDNRKCLKDATALFKRLGRHVEDDAFMDALSIEDSNALMDAYYYLGQAEAAVKGLKEKKLI